MVRSPPFQGGNTGSNPVGSAKAEQSSAFFYTTFPPFQGGNTGSIRRGEPLERKKNL